jgi:hypothetical protein
VVVQLKRDGEKILAKQNFCQGILAKNLPSLWGRLHSRLLNNYRVALLQAYFHSEHGLGRSEEVVTGTKARLRISVFRDSAIARA